MSAPRFSVIVPAHDSSAVLPTVLGAIAASDLPRDAWELIVVDDASRDDTAEVAGRFADQVVRLREPAGGPAKARNHGVARARGDWVVFVDADVVLHTDSLSGFARAIDEHPEVAAIFGAYDDAPPASGFVSQYRNLLHRYVHVEGAGEADTFWSGCGAVRRDLFNAAGGFDARRFPRPQIEDIELGYRLRDRGGHILLRPEIQGAHLKRWHFAGALRTDLFDRGVPWVRLLLERRKLAHHAKLNLKRGERLKAVSTALALAALLAGAISLRIELIVVAAVLFGAVAWSTRRQVRWFAERRGAAFALATVPMIWWYYLISGSCVVIGLVQHLAAGSRVADSAPTRFLNHDGDPE